MATKPKKEKQTDSEKLLCPKAGTATSFPSDRTASPTDMNIVNVMFWVKKDAYED